MDRGKSKASERSGDDKSLRVAYKLHCIKFKLVLEANF